MSAFAAHVDDNQQFTSTGVVGTLGTADTAGTAEGLPIAVDPATGAQWVKVINGTVSSALALDSGTITTIQAGTQNLLGTVNTIGTLPQVSVGTLPTVTLTDYGTNVNLVTGTINVLPQVSVGTLPTLNITSGTLNSLPQISVGTLPTVSLSDYGTNVNVVTGTIQSSGTTTGVGVVSNLTNGSVNVLTGTVTRVSNIGTVESGTFQLNPNPTVTPLNFGTLGTAGGSFFATISAASGAGTFHYVQGVDIVMQSGTADVRVLAGTAIQGTGVLAAGQFTPGGGIAKTWPMVPFKTGTNSELVYHFVGAGTAFINVNYWKAT